MHESKIKKYQAIFFPIFDIALNGLNYFFHIFISWYLVPEKYGTLNSLVSFLSILLVLGIAFQTYTAKEIVKNKAIDFDITYIFRSALFYMEVLLIVLLACSPFIKLFTRADYISIFLIILISSINIVLSVLRGIFQGNGDFFCLNKSFYIEVISKMFFIVALLRVFRNVNLVLLSILLGMGIATIYSLAKSKDKIRLHVNAIKNINIKESYIKIFKVIIANFFFYFFTSIDMIMVNFYLPEESGVYAVILKYNQLLQFAGLSIMTVFVTMLSNNLSNRVEFNNKIKKLFSLIFVMSIVALVFYKYIAPLTVSIFFGTAYKDAGNYLWLGLIPYIFIIYIFLIININVILERTHYLWILFIAAIIITILITIFHSNIETIFILEAIFYFSLMIILFVQFKVERS